MGIDPKAGNSGSTSGQKKITNTGGQGQGTDTSGQGQGSSTNEKKTSDK